MVENFKDLFSKQAQTYQQFRPTYPPALFQYLQSLTPNHNLAWDCGTGNGQSAVGLASYFGKVYGTDPSTSQIENAQPHPRIRYNVEKSEECSLPDASVDLVTVAQALHWFNFDKFYAQVRRVLKPNGILAVWTYGLPSVSPEVDKVIGHFHDTIVGNFWQAENQLVVQGYTTIPFPFEELATPAFSMQREMSCQELLGLFNSWSAVQRYKDTHGRNPVDLIEQELLHSWGEVTETRVATWQIPLRVGRIA